MAKMKIIFIFKDNFILDIFCLTKLKKNCIIHQSCISLKFNDYDKLK